MFKFNSCLILCLVIGLTYFSTVHGQRPIDSLKAAPIEINESEILRFRRGPCPIEDSLSKVFKNLSVEKLVQELKQPDFHFQCWINRNYRTFSKRRFIQNRLSEDRNAATPYLIKFIKRKPPELQAIALEVIQYADESVLEPYKSIFLKTSKSENVAVRNRSLSILARIKNSKIEKIMLDRLNSINSNWLKKYNHSFELMIKLLLYSPIDRASVEKGLIYLIENNEISDENLTQLISLMHSFNMREDSEVVLKKYVYWLNHHPNPEVIRRAAQGLGEVQSGIQYLLAGTHHKNPHVRANSAINLTQHREFSLKDHDEAIGEILIDSNPMVLQYFFNGISWLKLLPNQKKELLKKMIKHSDKILKSTRLDYGLYMLRQCTGIPVQDFNFITQNEAQIVMNYFEVVNSDPTYRSIFRSSTRFIAEQNEFDFQFNSESDYLDVWRQMLKLN